MTLTRRSTLMRAGAAVAIGVIDYIRWRGSATAQSTPPMPGGDQRKAERSLGDPAAKVTVQEFFSLTCTHCAAFAQETMPQVQALLGEIAITGHMPVTIPDFAQYGDGIQLPAKTQSAPPTN